MVTTNALGIHQSDLIIRTAIMAGLHELRVSPELLDYCFASLPRDALTAKQYGEKDVQEAKRWYLATNIPVVYGKRLGEVQMPCITIVVMKSVESKNTLGDTNYMVREDSDQWPYIVSPFSPVSYDRTSGLFTIPDDIAAQIYPVKGQVIVSKTGTPFPILEVIDRKSFYIAPNVSEELAGATLRGMRPSKVITLGSARFVETYAVGVHTIGEPVLLTYLHSIVMFILLRRRLDLLEGRGLECTSLDTSQVEMGRYFEGSTENISSRFIMISGEVLQWWPEQTQERAHDAQVQPKVIKGGAMVGPNDDQTTMPVVGDEDHDFFALST